jgi:hypothetical protein
MRVLMESLNSHNLLETLRKLVCINQLGLAQYVFLSNKKHESLREILQSNINKELNLIEIEEKINDLESFLDTNLNSTFVKSIESILSIFEERSLIPPRLCIKVFSNSNHLSTLVRYPDLFIRNEDFAPEENTAFRKIANGEEPYYLSNNIPKDVEDELNPYENARIIKDKVVEYNQKKQEVRNPSEYDLDWSSCWKEVGFLNGEMTIPAPPQSCYKSTLVIPMSLNMSEMSNELKEHLFIDNGIDCNDHKKAIFGFLCMDHHDVNFFRVEIDVSMGYILADILSIYLFQQLICTQYSSIYYSAYKAINSNQ